MYLNQNNRGRRASQPAKNGRAARPANGGVAPPPYTPYQETNSYVQLRPNKARAVPKWVWILFVAASIVGIVVFGILQTCRANRQTHRADALDRRLAEYPPTRVELDALKAEWEEGRTKHEMEKRAYDADTERWRRAMQGHEAAKRGWAEEQERWARQKEAREREWKEEQGRWVRQKEAREREWKEEQEEQARQREKRERERREEPVQHRMQEGNVLGLSWGQIESHQCVRYGTREYTARLAFNVKEACQHMPIAINGATISAPHECIMEGDALVSRWNIDQGEAACKPYWGKLYDKGCIGWGSGKHRYEARLWDIHDGMDWMAMCTTTPADIRGHHLDAPTHCDNRGIFHGMVGMWDVDDYQCQ
ncbi:uncharacterized protein B0H18DRAFT_1010480 [Fomitopsis serialis]|uniref:uncharacterized protein n=1 Tax=Fomitopsis serialis TaxID=139415 RepID=UPI002007638B|nr:uncharacterized protein B0H18DRAFT_1010480 [Neoantrodia serialis]KAH9924857.1 hypothetical protein B0H18DRAFT_1010480 [Neoantrodia serialis]